MKIIVAVAVTALMYYTWILFRGDHVQVTERVQLEIQKAVRTEVSRILAKSNVLYYDIEVTKTWTKIIEDNEIIVFFELSYLEKGDLENHKIFKSGSVTLEKTQKEGSSNDEYWSSTRIDVAGQKIEFEKGIEFTPEDLLEGDE